LHSRGHEKHGVTVFGEVLPGPNADAIGMRPTKTERVCMDSPLEGDGFELPVRGRGQSVCRPFCRTRLLKVAAGDAEPQETTRAFQGSPGPAFEQGSLYITRVRPCAHHRPLYR
jgi:hypothetical protein